MPDKTQVARRKNAGLCVSCGISPAEQGRTQCGTCAANVREQSRERYRRNPETHRERSQNWSRENRVKKDAMVRDWLREHPEHHRKYHREYQRSRRKRDDLFRLSKNLSTALWAALRGAKYADTFEIVRYTKEAFVSHILGQLTSVGYICPRCNITDMRYGYEIDHAIPLCTATTEEEIVALFALSNLQALCPECNKSKGGKNDIGRHYYM